MEVGQNTPELHAYLDESESTRTHDVGTYVLAAAVCRPADADTTRAVMRGLLLNGQRKVHWHDESDPRRRLIIDVVARAPIDHLLIVRDGRSDERPERRRRHCLERLCHELAARGVTRMTAESRGPADDRRDRDMLDALRARRIAPGSLRLDHRPGPAEPLLWIPDAVCGALTRAGRGDPAFLNAISDRLTVITIAAP